MYAWRWNSGQDTFGVGDLSLARHLTPGCSRGLEPQSTCVSCIVDHNWLLNHEFLCHKCILYVHVLNTDLK